jgi:ADP-heptose:LPS heptosyltransferase
VGYNLGSFNHFGVLVFLLKVVISKLSNNRVSLPINGFNQPGLAVQFSNFRAIVNDETANYFKLVDQHGSFYQVVDDFSDMKVPGTRVLVIRDTGLGDVLLVTPLLRELAAEGLEVDFATSKQWIPLFENLPYLHACVDMNTVQKHLYKFVLDLCSLVENEEARGIFEHRVDAFGRYADYSLSDKRTLDYIIKLDEIEFAKDLLKGTKNPIAYVWTASVENRSWSVEKHSAVLMGLVQAGFTPVLLGSNLVTLEIPKTKNLSGGYTIRQTAAIMSQCQACVTPDTGLLHLASAIDLPTVCYWGAFPMSERASFRRENIFRDLTKRENCAKVPCRAYNCRNFQRDEFTISPCLDISISDIINSLKEVVVNDATNKKSASSGIEVRPRRRNRSPKIALEVLNANA